MKNVVASKRKKKFTSNLVLFRGYREEGTVAAAAAVKVGVDACYDLYTHKQTYIHTIM